MSKTNNEKIIYILAFVLTITMLSTSIAHAQGPVIGNGIEISDVMTLENISVIASAFVLSAIGWAVLGWQKKRRTVKTPIDPKKLLKTIVIGIGVGVLTFGYTLLFGDGSLEHLHVTTFEGYKQLLMWTFPAIVTLVVVLKKMFPDLRKLTNGIDSDLRKLTNGIDSDLRKLTNGIDSNLEEPEPIDPEDDLPPGKEAISVDTGGTS